MQYILSAPPVSDREILRENITKLELGLKVDARLFQYQKQSDSLVGMHLSRECPDHRIFWSYDKFLKNEFNAV